MTQTVNVIDMITKEAMLVAHENLSFLGTINRDYDSEFAKTGAKIGDSLRIRKPAEFAVTSGRAIDIQEIQDDSTSLTVATQKHVAFRVNSGELALGIDFMSDRYITPAVKRLVSTIEDDVLTGCTKRTAYTVGTAGTPPTDLVALGDARARLNQALAPKQDRCTQFDSVTMGGVVNGLKGLFQDQAQVKEAFREGFYGRTAMADFYENEKTWTMTNTGDVAGTLDTVTLANGDVTLAVANLSAAPTAGMVFTIAGVYDVHPETKAPYAQLKQFVVGSNTASTTTSIKLDNSIYVSGAKQNCYVGSAYTTTGAVAFFGSASTAYRQNLMYHKNAFAFVAADLPIVGGADKCARQTQDGLSLRVWMDGDIRNDEMLLRIDMLYGYAAIRPEWACRISN